MRQLSVEGSELYCYSTKGDRNLVASQALSRMDVTQLEQRAYTRIAILRGRNARECLSELVETMEINALHSLAFLPQYGYCDVATLF